MTFPDCKVVKWSVGTSGHDRLRDTEDGGDRGSFGSQKAAGNGKDRVCMCVCAYRGPCMVCVYACRMRVECRKVLSVCKHAYVHLCVQACMCKYFICVCLWYVIMTEKRKQKTVFLTRFFSTFSHRDPLLTSFPSWVPHILPSSPQSCVVTLLMRFLPVPLRMFWMLVGAMWFPSENTALKNPPLFPSLLSLQ